MVSSYFCPFPRESFVPGPLAALVSQSFSHLLGIPAAARRASRHHNEWGSSVKSSIPQQCHSSSRCSASSSASSSPRVFPWPVRQDGAHLAGTIQESRWLSVSRLKVRAWVWNSVRTSFFGLSCNWSTSFRSNFGSNLNSILPTKENKISA